MDPTPVHLREPTMDSALNVRTLRK